MPTKKDFDNLSPADFMDQVEAERAARDYADEPYEFLRVQQEKRRRRRKELWTRSALFVLAILAFIALVMVWSCAPAGAHSDVAMVYPLRCCAGTANNGDCAPIEGVGLVKRHVDGWFIRETGETIPFDKTEPSMDLRFHRCKLPNGKTRCFFSPESGT